MGRHAPWIILTFSLLSGCDRDAPAESAPIRPTPTQRAPGEAQPSLADWLGPGAAETPGSPHAHAAPHAQAATPTAATGGPMVRGTVRETMDAGGYTYMLVRTGDQGDVWIAGSRMQVSVGARVEASGMPMRDFHSSTLDRTFETLILASQVRIVGGEGAESAPAPHDETHPGPAPSLPPGHPPIGR